MGQKCSKCNYNKPVQGYEYCDDCLCRTCSRRPAIEDSWESAFCRACTCSVQGCGAPVTATHGDTSRCPEHFEKHHSSNRKEEVTSRMSSVTGWRNNVAVEKYEALVSYANSLLAIDEHLTSEITAQLNLAKLGMGSFANYIGPKLTSEITTGICHVSGNTLIIDRKSKSFEVFVDQVVSMGDVKVRCVIFLTGMLLNVHQQRISLNSDNANIGISKDANVRATSADQIAVTNTFTFCTAAVCIHTQELETVIP